MVMVAGTAVLTFVLAIGGAWAEGKVTITREESKPKDVEVKAGGEVRFITTSRRARPTPTRARWS
jgi:hypothetical protein